MTSAFPGHSRTLPTGYNQHPFRRCSTSVVRATLRPDQYRLGTKVVAVARTSSCWTAASGSKGDGAIDARGAANLDALDLGWQKFVGARISARPRRTGSTGRSIMDATVDQIDGYRFVYCLPFAPDRLLVEDTYYSTDPGARSREAIERAASTPMSQAQGWRDRRGRTPGERRAAGRDGRRFRRLLAGDRRPGREARPARRLLPSDHRLFAARCGAARLAASPPAPISPALPDLLRAEAARLWRERRLLPLLNRMLFRAADAGRALPRARTFLPARSGDRSSASMPADRRRGDKHAHPEPAGRRCRSAGPWRAHGRKRG